MGHSSNLDRVPVIPILRFAAIRLAGYHLNEVLDTWDNVAKAEIEVWQRFGHDGVFARIPYDVDAAALGARIIYSEDNPPTVGPPYLVASLEDVHRIDEPNPEACQGMRMERALAEALVTRLGRDVPIIGYCQGPLRFASQLRGLQPFMEDLYGNRELVFELLELSVRISAIRAQYLVDAGVHMIEIGDPVASGNLLSPSFYETFAFDYQRRLIDRIHTMGDVYVILHICGDTSRILPRMAETGADVLSLDHKVDLGFARSRVGDHVVLMGNVDPNHTLAFGSPEQVRMEALECIRKAGPTAFILSSGCAMGRDTPPNNISALVRAVSPE